MSGKNTTMTNEQINIKIAELCGLFRIAPLKRTTRKGNDYPSGVVLWYCSEDHGGAKTYDKLPNYVTNLNACHEFEKTLTDQQFDTFQIELSRVVFEHPRVVTYPVGFKQRRFWSATARQRCEAFLRVHGQWEEEV